MSEMKDWRKICAECQEGEFPKDCEYYGEPNGCNSPTYGKHPTCKESSAVVNMAKAREALKEFVEYSELVCQMGMFNRERLVAITTKARDALSAPPRNCDRFDNAKDAFAAYAEEQMLEHNSYDDWLFAEWKGGTK